MKSAHPGRPRPAARRRGRAVKERMSFPFERGDFRRYIGSRPALLLAVPARPSPPAPRGSFLLSLGQEVVAAVLRPARLGLLGAERAFLAVGDDRDPVGLHALGDQ